MTVDRINSTTGEILPARAKTDTWVDVLAPIIDLAENIAATDFAPVGLRGSVPKTTAAILYARELGLPPMTGLASIHVVNGRPGISAELMRAMVLDAGHEYRIRANTNDVCRIAGRRKADRDDPDAWQEFSFTRAEAQTAGLAGKDTYKFWGSDMLLARASTRMCRAIFTDVIKGFRSSEELDDMATQETAPAAEPVRIEPPKRATRGRGASRAEITAAADRPPAIEVEVVADPVENQETAPEPTSAPHGGERVTRPEPVQAPAPREPETRPEPVRQPAPREDRITRPQQVAIQTVCSKLGVKDPDRLYLIGLLRGHVRDDLIVPIESTGDLTEKEAGRIITTLGDCETDDDLRRAAEYYAENMLQRAAKS